MREGNVYDQRQRSLPEWPENGEDGLNDGYGEGDLLMPPTRPLSLVIFSRVAYFFSTNYHMSVHW